jgi:hypothetical protein
VALTRQRVEIAKLPKGYLVHQNILSQQSLKSILPDGMRRVKLQPRNQLQIMQTATGGE